MTFQEIFAKIFYFRPQNARAGTICNILNQKGSAKKAANWFPVLSMFCFSIAMAGNQFFVYFEMWIFFSFLEIFARSTSVCPK